MVARSATQQRPHSRDDFTNRERLRKVVIGAEVQAFNSFVYIPARGEKEHWRIHALSPHLARGNVNERIEGLNLGADDYLPKPFSMSEVRAEERRVGKER